MPKISCVMPTRNRAKTIYMAINSIINQTEKNWELIVVDDHSGPTDNTEELISQLSDDRIKYYRLSDENGIGISAARNFGNMISSAEYIAVMDSDDVAYPNRFEQTLEVMAKKKPDVFYADIDYWYPNEDKIEKYHSRPFNLSDFKRYDFIPHVTACYKRRIALDFPYNSFFRKAEDYDFFARVYRHGLKLEYLPLSLVKYRKHSNSISEDQNTEFDYSQIVKDSLVL